MSPNLAAIVVDTSFSSLGVAATYTPPSGPAVQVVVIFGSPDEISGLGSSEFIGRETLIDVRKSEIAAPASRGVFLIDGTSYRVLSEPVARDKLRLVWRCSCKVVD